jgi:hypothetical protein
MNVIMTTLAAVKRGDHRRVVTQFRVDSKSADRSHADRLGHAPCPSAHPRPAHPGVFHAFSAYLSKTPHPHPISSIKILQHIAAKPFNHLTI